MDWLKSHIHEVILPNLREEVGDFTGIELDEGLGDFKVAATALDPDEEESEEYEVTIHFGDICLVDACFLLEEIESGSLPLCQEAEELTDTIIQAKIESLRANALPTIRQELAERLESDGWDVRLAHLLDARIEVVESPSGMRSSGGYPPMALSFQHPDHDIDAFEVTVRIDPVAARDPVPWKPFMERLERALRAIGEDQDTSPVTGGSDAGGDGDGPSAEDLADPELGELEAEAGDDDDASDGGGGGSAADRVAGDLLGRIKDLLGAAAAADDADDADDPDLDDEDEAPAKKASKKGAKAKTSAKKKAAKEKAPAKKKAGKKAPAKKAAKKAPAKKAAKKAPAKKAKKKSRKA